MKRKIITLTIISLILLSMIGLMIPELASGSGEEITITVFDQEGRNMAEEGPQDIVEENMEIEVREPKWFGLSYNVVAEGTGGSLTAEIEGGYYDIVVIWMGEEIYKESRDLRDDVSIHMTTTPSRMIEDWSREQISTSSDLRDITTPHKSIQLGAGEQRNHMYIDLGGTRYGLPAVMEIDGEDHVFQFRNTEPGEYTDWTDDFLIWESAYHYSASSSELVGDNMMVLQWQYGYFDTGGAHIDRIVQGAGAGALVGALGGATAGPKGAGLGALAGAGVGAIGTAVATSVEPELARTSAEGGVSAITLVITPRYTVINSIVVDSTGAEVEFSLGIEGENIWEQKAVSEDVLYEVELSGAGDQVQDIAIGCLPIISEYDEWYYDLSYTGENQIGVDGDYGTHCSEGGSSSATAVLGSEETVNYGYDGQDYYFEQIVDSNAPSLDVRFNDLELEQNKRYILRGHMEWYGDDSHGMGTCNEEVVLYHEDFQDGSVSLGSHDKYITEEESDVYYDGKTWNSYREIGHPRQLKTLTEFSGIESTETLKLRFNQLAAREYQKRIISASFEIVEMELEDPEEERLIFEDEVINPATRLLRGHIPVYQPAVGTSVEVNNEYSIIALDVRDLPDVTVSLDWASPDVHIYLTRFMLTSDMGNWTETCYLLSTDRAGGFEGVRFILNEPGKFMYNADFHDYGAWTNPGAWTSHHDWSTVYYNGTNLNYPSPEDWGLGGWWAEQKWEWSSFWQEVGPLVKLALVGIGLLIIGLIILIVAPWIIVGLIKVLVFIFRQLGKAGKNLASALKKGKEGGW